MSDHPTNYDEAMSLAMEWATGKRSHWNDFKHSENVTINTAQADAAEVEKWCAIARAFSAGDLSRVAKNQSDLTSVMEDRIQTQEEGKRQVKAETPERVMQTIEDLAELLDNRQLITVVRVLAKKADSRMPQNSTEFNYK